MSMHRKAWSVVLASALAIGALPYPHAASAANATGDIVSSVSFREGPGTSYDRIRYLQDGEQVEVISQPNSYWYEVKDANGQVGYVSAKAQYIEVRETAESPAVAYRVAVVKSVSFREGPGTGYDRIRYLAKGERLTILDEPNRYWYQVSTEKGETGYVSSSEQYLSLIEQAAEPGPAPEPQPPVSDGNGTIVKSVSFRTGPGTGYDRIRYLQTGERVTVLEQTSSSWYKVEDGHGVVGYTSTSSQYITTTYTPEPIEEDANANAVIQRSVSFREGPSTGSGRIRYLQTGERVTVIGQPSNYWYEVKDGQGIVGYVSSNESYIFTTYNPLDRYAHLSDAEKAQLVIDAGMQYLGTPYEFGSDRGSTATFDCSDFTQQAFYDALQLRIPSDSRQQGDYVRGLGPISYDWQTLQPGDLMFFMDYKGWGEQYYEGIDKDSETITHVAIYMGDGKLLHTYSEESGGVLVGEMSSSWQNRFLFGGSAF